MRATRSSEPVPGIKHGLTGFTQHKCGCFTCRRAKAEAQQRYKDKQRGILPPDAPAGAGKQEQLTFREISELGSELTNEQASLANIALMHAKLLDTIEKEQRWHLLNATTKSLRETMKELRATLPKRRERDPDADGEDEDDDLGPLRGFGQP